MSFRTVSRGCIPCVGALLLLASPLAAAEAVDPAVVGERLQRLNANIEALEQTVASQRRQIESLTAEVSRLRTDAADQKHLRPWAEDLKRVADAVNEVDRKRIADSEQVVKVLNELRKAMAAAAEAPRPSVSRPAPAEPAESGKGGKDAVPEKALPYVVRKGDRLSDVVNSFNAEARKQGYQPITLDQVVKFNKLQGANKIFEGMTLQLPIVTK
ncbi:MAG: LysM peptidoglycan-binding domain-containing protein [Verrucomicrobiales bacterium]|nr:LysM peptidoglycan-binding domain-containing protein [Verrucomicrobiales bacterium]